MIDSTCIFCRIVKKEIPSKIVFEDNEVIAFEDIKPKAPVHIVLAPKNHIEKVSNLTKEDVHLAGSLILAAKGIAKKLGIGKSGYRIVINCNRDGGQEVFHLHLHLLGGRPLEWPPG